MFDKITSLRMERQFLHRRAGHDEYDTLYRDLAPGQSVYWQGFGDPPSLSFRADFNDMEHNRRRQLDRRLVKGRFQGGNLGWIPAEDMALFAGLARKPLVNPTPIQSAILSLIEREGPMNIALMKEMTGYLVKEITPVLHRLQEAFLIYEDHYDGEWDRGWYRFDEMFPDVDLAQYTREHALCVLLRRYAHRMVWFDAEMPKSFYKIPGKDIKAAVAALLAEGTLTEYEGGYMSKEDFAAMETYRATAYPGVFVLHRNDFLVKSNEHWLKVKYKHAEWDILQYLLVDGMFAGAVWGHFKNGPFVIEDVFAEAKFAGRRDEILAAVYRVNSREHSPVQRFMGEGII